MSTKHTQLDSNLLPPFLVFSGFGESDGMMRFCGRRLNKVPASPLPCYFWVSGFSFSLASVLQHVPYDPNLCFLFFGEETSMTVRLWTHGYDFYCPASVVCYHLWRRNYRPIFREVKLPQDQEKRMERIARLRVRLQLDLPLLDADQTDPLELLEAKVDLEPRYGMGSVRPLYTYWEYSGVNLPLRSAMERSYRGGMPDDTSFWEDPMKLVMKLLAGRASAAVAPTTPSPPPPPPPPPTLNDILNALQIESALNVWVYGSRVYGTVDANSDWDFIAVVDKSPFTDAEVTRKFPHMDVSVYSATQWRKLLVDHEMGALECLWLPPHCVLLSNKDWLSEFKLDLQALRHSVSAQVGNSWVKANKKLSVEADFAPRIAKKSLFHVFRILDFALQIGRDGRITDYSSCNETWASIMKDESTDWAHYKSLYQKRYNTARSAFKQVAPK